MLARLRALRRFIIFKLFSVQYCAYSAGSQAGFDGWYEWRNRLVAFRDGDYLQFRW